MLLLYIAILLGSFYLLAVICEDFFVSSLDEISKRLKLPSDVAGATFMAVGSSAPELFTSLFAVFRPGDHANLGAGTIVGSAIFNILVIIGASVYFKQAKLTWQPIIRDMIFYSISIVMLLFAFWDGKIELWEGITFVIFYVLYIITVINWKKILPYNDIDPIDIIEEEEKKHPFAGFMKKVVGYVIPDCTVKPDLYIVTFTISIIGIAGLSFALVEAAVNIADILRINPTIVALTVLAAGTSIPDLLSSVIVAKRGRGDMAVTNALGSNVFDILFCLGLPWTLVMLTQGKTFIPVATENLTSSVLLLFGTVVAVMTVLIARKWTLGRKAGIVLIALYLLYVGYNIMQVI